MNAERYHFKVGTFDCIAINDAVEPNPVTDLAMNVPEEQLAQALAEHGFSSTELIVAFNCLFIHTGDHRVLVDTGCGRGMDRLDGELLQNLQAEGIVPSTEEYPAGSNRQNHSALQMICAKKVDAYT